MYLHSPNWRLATGINVFTRECGARRSRSTFVAVRPAEAKMFYSHHLVRVAHSTRHRAPGARDGVHGRDAEVVLRARVRARGRASSRAARRTVRVPGPRTRPRGVSDHSLLGTVRRRGRAQAGDAAVPAAVREAHAARRADRAAPGNGHRASHLAFPLPRRLEAPIDRRPTFPGPLSAKTSPARFPIFLRDDPTTRLTKRASRASRAPRRVSAT